MKKLIFILSMFILLPSCSNLFQSGGYITDDFSSDVLAGLSVGAGFHFTNMTLDVGFMNLGPAGFIMGFSISNKQN